MFAIIALCMSGIALVASGACAWLTWIQAGAAQRMAKDAAKAWDEAMRLREVTPQTATIDTLGEVQEPRDIREALQIAQRSARAAEECARATRILAESGQRAYVALGAVQVIRSDLGAGFPTMVRCEAHNSGKTPAFSMVSCQWLVAMKEFPAEPEYVGIESLSPSDLGPGGVSATDASSAGFDALVAQALRNRELTVFLYGISRYKDLFGMSRQTRWAFSWNMEKRQFTRCAHHNEMT